MCLFARALHTQDGLDLLEDDQLQARGGGEAGPDGHDAGVLAAGALLRHDLHSSGGGTKGVKERHDGRQETCRDIEGACACAWV